MKMNQTPVSAKVLEVLLLGKPQGNIHIYVNGGIRVSKINFEKHEEFLKQVQNKTSMMVPGGRYSFEYQEYIRGLQKSLNYVLTGKPEGPIEIKEKYLNPKHQELLNKQYRMLYSPGNNIHNKNHTSYSTKRSETRSF
jgi:hypothetical protein